MNKKLFNKLSANPPDASNHHAIPDTGTTGNFTMYDTPFLNKRQIRNGPTVLLPDDRTMKTAHIGTFNMPSFPTKTRIDCTFSAETK